VEKRRNLLHSGVRFALFATSYSPLFLIMIMKVSFSHSAYLHWGGFTSKAFLVFIKYFGLCSVLLGFIIVGSIGLFVFISQIKSSTNLNGFPVLIKDLKNKNSEAISYIGTYIIPFLFQDYSGLYEVLSVTILLVVIYFIYINSTLILINPVLNLRYSLYEVEFVNDHLKEAGKSRSGLIITEERFLEEEDQMMFKRIGHKLYFAMSRTLGE
jgi:hypothetical protein